MWPFLLILSIVPMVFFWSDSVGEMFPTLKQYLPDKKADARYTGDTSKGVPGVPGNKDGFGTWYELKNENGYLAFTLSADGQYRLTVGCRPNTPPAIQVTHSSGTQIPSYRALNYQFGSLPLEAGYSVSADVLGATAQFADVLLEGKSREVYAQFRVAAHESGLIARNLQNNCAPTPTN